MKRFESARVLLCAVTALAQSAMGQADRRGMIVIDDGTERHVLSYAEPDVELVVKPYLNRSDLRIFRDALALSEAQETAVEQLIAQYLAQFDAMLREMHPDTKTRGANDDAVRAKDGNEPGDDASDRQRGTPGIDPVQSILLEELKADGLVKSSLEELPVQPMIGVGVSRRGPDEEGGPPPPPEVTVSIAFGGEDDRLDEALRAKLQKAAQRATPRIAEAVRAQVNADHEAMERAPGERSAAEEIADRFSKLQALRERISAFKKAHAALLSAVYADTQRLLSTEQLERWPAFERTLRRIKTLAWSALDGEATDLIAMLEGLELSDADRAVIAEEIERYELLLDVALQRRNILLETADQEIDVALYTGEHDKAKSMAERLSRARVTIRELNDRTITSIADLLQYPADAKFEREALAASYPAIFRRTIGQRAFDEAITSSLLDEETQLAVLELANSHTQLVQNVNSRLHRAVRREQEARLTSAVEDAIDMMQGIERDLMADLGQSVIAAAFQERQNLDAQHMRVLYSLLPAELVATLPAIPKHDVGERIRAEHSEGGVKVLVD